MDTTTTPSTHVPRLSARALELLRLLFADESAMQFTPKYARTVTEIQDWVAAQGQQ